VNELTKEERVGFKSPAVMGFVGAIVLVFFGILGRDGIVAFEISRRVDAVQLPSIDFDSSTLGLFSGIVMLLIGAASPHLLDFHLWIHWGVRALGLVGCRQLSANCIHFRNGPGFGGADHARFYGRSDE
jgi:hypothetical protein